MTWLEHEGGLIGDAGDVGGDAQAGPACSRRFWAESSTEPGRFEVVEVYAYSASVGETFFVQAQWSYTLCTDLADPGGTEVWADTLYEEPGLDGCASIAEATKRARSYLQGLEAQDFAHQAEELAAGIRSLPA